MEESKEDILAPESSCASITFASSGVSGSLYVVTPTAKAKKVAQKMPCHTMEGESDDGPPCRNGKGG